MVPAEAQPKPQLPQITKVALLTGPGSINETDVRYQVHGTDLGIMWADQQKHILTAFGDTFGTGGAGSGPVPATPAQRDWRSNTLARGSDQDPAHGLILNFVTDRPGHAKELVPSLKRDNEEISTIPTGGVNVEGRDYLAYMSVRHFGPAGGQWTTNYSAVAYSDDGGRNWVPDPETRRPNTAAFDDHFQMIAYAKRDGFVYAFGTPNGRFGAAYLARVPERQLLDQAAYQYWTGSGWQRGNSVIAAPIMPAPVGELSVRYDSTFHRWMSTYLDESRHAIVLRFAPQPTGPWSPEIQLATADKYPSLYGGFQHPASNGTDLYFTMTQFNQYNVSLMHAKLPHDVLETLPPSVPATPIGRPAD
ncbi:MAG: DUF4185 domain-containing protein [Pseudonocardiaceae bacterium]